MNSYLTVGNSVIRRLTKLRSFLWPEITAMHSCVRLCSEQTGLLQHSVCRSTVLHYCSTSASSERSSATRQRSHTTSALRDLHWLPIHHRISYKLCVLMYLVHTGNSPSYLSDLVTTTANIPSRIHLRSARTHRYEPLTNRLKFGKRRFSHAGPKAWNSLPHAIQQIPAS